MTQTNFATRFVSTPGLSLCRSVLAVSISAANDWKNGLRGPESCWQPRCFPVTMDNANDIPVSETAARRMGSKARRSRLCKDSAHNENIGQEPVVELTAADKTAAVESVTRARSLLRATLRVWELKE